MKFLGFLFNKSKGTSDKVKDKNSQTLAQPPTQTNPSPDPKAKLVESVLSLYKDRPKNR